MFSPQEFLRNPQEYVHNYREYRNAQHEMRPYDEVLLDADAYFGKLTHVLKKSKTNEMTVVLNPYQSISSPEILSALKKACRSNHSVTDLTIQVGSQDLASFEFAYFEIPEISWEKEQIEAMSNALLSLPCLNTLKVDLSHLTADEDAAQPFLELWSGLPSAKELRNLQVAGYMLRHSDANFNVATSTAGPLAKLCLPLQNHPALEHIALTLQSDEMASATKASVTPILEAFQSLPNLKTLEVTDQARMAFGQAQLTCSGADLQDFLQANKQVQSLKLWLERYGEEGDCEWKESDLSHVAQGLSVNSSLRTLVVGIDANAPEGRATPAAAAKQLDVSDHTASTADMGSKEFCCEDSDDDSLSGCSSHSTGSRCCKADPKTELLHVLQFGANNVLSELSLFDMALPAKMAVYLDLNAAGKHRLVESHAGPEEWMAHIVHKQPQLSLDATFEMLRMNPAALAVAELEQEESQPQQPNKTKKAKKTKKSLRKKFAKALFGKCVR